MKKTIIGNWKSNKNEKEALQWLEVVGPGIMRIENLEISIAPQFSLLNLLNKEIKDEHYQLSLSAQDVSPFEEGSYTGEVSAKSLTGLIKYVLIGHSERRKYFGETDEMIVQKVKMALKYGLIPIVCISNLKQARHFDTNHILYEPLFAIGSGESDTPEHANQMARKIKETLGESTNVLYGGSVDSENVISFVLQSQVDGVCVGGASLNPQEFLKIIENASAI